MNELSYCIILELRAVWILHMCIWTFTLHALTITLNPMIHNLWFDVISLSIVQSATMTSHTYTHTSQGLSPQRRHPVISREHPRNLQRPGGGLAGSWGRRLGRRAARVTQQTQVSAAHRPWIATWDRQVWYARMHEREEGRECEADFKAVGTRARASMEVRVGVGGGWQLRVAVP